MDKLLHSESPVFLVYELKGLCFPSHRGWGDEVGPDAYKTLHSVSLPQIPFEGTEKVLKLVSLKTGQQE